MHLEDIRSKNDRNCAWSSQVYEDSRGFMDFTSIIYSTARQDLQDTNIVPYSECSLQHEKGNGQISLGWIKTQGLTTATFFGWATSGPGERACNEVWKLCSFLTLIRSNLWTWVDRQDGIPVRDATDRRERALRTNIFNCPFPVWLESKEIILSVYFHD